MSRLTQALCALATAAAVAGCGGGGDDAPSSGSAASAGSDVSAANYQTFAAPLAHAVMDSSGVSELSSLIAGGGGLAAASAAGRAVTLSAGFGSRIQAVNTQSFACYSGSFTVTVNDGDNSNTLSGGDGIAITFDNCRPETAEDPVVTGRMDLAIDSVTLTSSGDPSAMAMHGSFTSLTAAGSSLNGGYAVSLTVASNGDVSTTISLNDLQSTVSGQTLVYSTTVTSQFATSGAGSFAINGRMGVGGQIYLLHQDAAFVQSAGAEYPSSGALRLSDAAGDAVVVKPQSDNTITFEFYPAGATTPAATLTGQTWAGFGG